MILKTVIGLSICIFSLNSSLITQISENDLQRRLKEASRGDTIFVSGGKYVGNFVFDKSIVLIGKDKPILSGEGKGSVVTITADSCVLKGFRIEKSGRNLLTEDAGILIKSNDNQIIGNELTDILFGIYLLDAMRNNIFDNFITGIEQLEFGERGSGIHVWNSYDNLFLRNTIENARDGFYIQNANRLLVAFNNVSRTRYGLHYMYADTNTFISNIFSGNVAGAAIMYSKNIVMRHNLFVHNRGFSSFGILFQDCHNSIADSNIIHDNVVGLFFESSTNNKFRHNIISQNDAALKMFQNSERNIFTENNFIDNLTPLILVGKRTNTVWSVNGKGNYWSSYDGYDIDGNGIGDIEMKIQNVFDYLEGKNSNIRLYLYSPASQAIAAATEAFPIVAINEEIDKNPLMQPVKLNLITDQIYLNQHYSEIAPTCNNLYGWLTIPFGALFLIGLLRTYRSGIK